MNLYAKPVYVCEFCRKLYKHNLKSHEKYCGKNPANHHKCFDCKHLHVERIKASSDTYAEKTFHCTKLDKDLHSFKAEKINHSCLGSTERMPMECPDFQDSMDDYFDSTSEGGSPVKFISSIQTPTP